MLQQYIHASSYQVQQRKNILLLGIPFIVFALRFLSPTY